MIAAWMLYLTAVTALIAVASHAAEMVMRLCHCAGRGAWIAGLLFMSLAPVVTRNVVSSVPSVADIISPLARADRSVSSTASAPINDIKRALTPRMVNVSRQSSFITFDSPLFYIWISGSIALCCFLFASHVRLAMLSRRWKPSIVDGVPVLISENVGPAVLGAIKPRIVVPSWAIDLPAEQRLLLLTHEAEHVRRRDPLLLSTGWLALVATPWNPVLWYAFSRLRLAIETDCDQQVLRSRPDAYTYGSLLLDIGARMFAPSVPMTALSGRTSDLRKRILLMTPSFVRFRRLRAIGGAVAALAAVALACQVPQPAKSRPAATEDNHATAFADLQTFQDSTRRNIVSDSVIRRAVEMRYPDALRGRMGKHTYIWFLADNNGNVLRSATGRQGLSRWSYNYLRDRMPIFLNNLTPAERAKIKADGMEYLDIAAARRKFPDVRQLAKDEELAMLTSRLKGTDIDFAWLRLSQ